MAFQSGGIVEQINVTATAAGTTTLVGSTSSSATLGKQIQVFTGTSTQTVVLPNATSMVVGQKFEIINESTQALTLQFQDATSFTDAAGIAYGTIYPHQSLVIKLQTNSTADGTWTVVGNTSAGVSLIQPTVQKFLSGSGTYTTPANVAYIQVEMVGGGSGGSGSGATQPSGGAGGNSTFGSSLLTAAGGGAPSGTTGGTGGTPTINSPAIQVVALSGANGGSSGGTISSGVQGGTGGSSPFGGAGAQGSDEPGGNAVTNAGSGGAGASVITTGNAGGGGASGGYIKAIITSPAASYSYSVGAAGTAGTAGASGFAGGAGGSGAIIVTEFYNQTIASGVTVTASSAPTKQIFLSGSGTYTRPTGVQYIQVRMVGGGGGGGGSGTAAGTAGGTGGTTTFGSSLLSAGGGTGSTWGVSTALGGVSSLGTGPIGIALPGSAGGGFIQVQTASISIPASGTPGAPSALGGAGLGGSYSTAGSAGQANTGGGGGGGGNDSSTSVVTGGGGGSGGYVEAIINNPSATYSYSVGSGGTAGTAGTNGFAGGAGGSGIIEVTEYYTALATGGFTGGGANTPTIQKFLASPTGATNYAFTVTALTTATSIGAVYSNNGFNYTVLVNASIGATTLVCSGTGTPASSGNLTYVSGAGQTGTIAFSAFNGAYITPSNVLYVQVEMVGGGGGGAGSGTSFSGGTGGTGGTTTFGSSLLSATGGTGGSDSQTGGTGGTATLGTGPIGIANSGGNGSPASQSNGVANNYPGGGLGAATPFGGAGGLNAVGGAAAVANTGSGGGGANVTSSGGTQNTSGGGGGAGGYVKAIITNPAPAYSYAIGAGGSAGTAGSSGSAGGAGGSGVIIVTEYYANGTVGTATSITGSLNTANCTAPTKQVFLSGSGTYTTPTSPRIPLYIKVRMAGAGAGGGGVNTAGGAASSGSSSGSNTTFGSSLLIANSGSTGTSSGANNAAGGAGGSTTVNSPALSLISQTGGSGQAGLYAATTAVTVMGGNGGTNPFGGMGTGGSGAGSANAPAANTGAGGAGGGGNGTASGTTTGPGGGAGGYIEAIINNPSATYSYNVAAGGNAGGNGTAGSAGIIIVEEFYQ